MSKPPFIIPNRKGTELWPTAISPLPVVEFRISSNNLSDSDFALARQYAQRLLAENNGRLKQFFLAQNNASNLGVSQYTSRTVVLTSGLNVRYIRNFMQEGLQVEVLADVIIQKAKEELLKTQRVLFVSVIDESAGFSESPELIERSWRAGRARYPNMFVVVLWPGRGGYTAPIYALGPRGALQIPDSFPDSLSAGPYTVGRDEGSLVPYPTGWWQTMGFGPAQFSQVWMQIDRSGSMTPSVVQADVDRFFNQALSSGLTAWYLESDVENAFITMQFINTDATSDYDVELVNSIGGRFTNTWQRRR